MNERERTEMMPITGELFSYACAAEEISHHLFKVRLNSRGKPRLEKFDNAQQGIAQAYETYHGLKQQLRQMGRAGILDIYQPWLEVLEDKIKEEKSRFTKYWGKSAIAA